MFNLPDLPDAVLRGLVLSAVTLVWIIFLVRNIGLRTFSKMTAFDFVVTLATGSLLASSGMVTNWASFVQGLTAISAILGLQVALAALRRSSAKAKSALENVPLLLMKDGVLLRDALASSRVSEADVMAKLRGANALDFSKVRAVVLETTGDISVLQGSEVDKRLLDGVRHLEA